METKSWRVPYCNPCMEHQRLAAEAQAMEAMTTLGSGCGITASIGGAIFLALLTGTGGGVLAIPLIAIILVLGIVLAARSADQCKTTAQARRDKAQAKRNEAVQSTAATCCRLEPAIVYHGWSGSVQSFTFYNAAYAERFRYENAKKLLG